MLDVLHNDLYKCYMLQEDYTSWYNRRVKQINRKHVRYPSKLCQYFLLCRVCVLHAEGALPQRYGL
jgi:hypothetical protein